MKRVALLVLALALPAFGAEWIADNAHSEVGFRIRHLMISNVKGKFKDYTVTLTTDDKDKLTKVEATIDAKSIDTGNEKRDEHLRSADFFDVEKQKDITFKSTKVTQSGKDKIKITGDLTMHGVTKPVTFDGTITKAMKDPFGGTRRALAAKTKINRKDFGLNWNKAIETGGVVVGDEVNIETEFEFTQKEEKKAE